MRYQKLGKTAIDVSVVALGTWGLGGGSVWSDQSPTVEDTGNLLSACREVGINYIDTAPVYGTGMSETLLGKALKGKRQDFVLQTKCSLNWRGEGGNFHYERDGYTVNNDTRPEAIRKDVEDSLKRLQTDYIDSLIVHYVCPGFPVPDTVDVLERLIEEGKIRAYGLSNSQPDDLNTYNQAAGSRQGASLVQEFFSILSPFHGRDYFPVCSRHDALFQTYGVLEEGFLTSPQFLDRTFPKGDIRSRLPWTEEPYRNGLLRAFSELAPLCETYHCSFPALFEAWALKQYAKMSLLVGMRTVSSVLDTAKCLDIPLSDSDAALMERCVASIQVPVLDK